LHEYDSFHRSRRNRHFHFFGIPLFLVASLGLLSAYRFDFVIRSFAIRFDAAILVLIAVGLWYAFLDWKVALAAGVAGLGCYCLGRTLPRPMLWTGAGYAIVAHLVGHIAFEKNLPALLRHPAHVLIAPLWILSLWTKSLREIS
jgi:uncharacterized membrane protein YGL010W